MTDVPLHLTLPYVVARQLVPGNLVCVWLPVGIASHSPLECIINASCWLLRILLAEISCDRERYHTRIGSIGISVKKNNVLPALSPGLLHGLYNGWDELIENKATRGGRSGWEVGKQQHCRNAWFCWCQKQCVAFSPPRAGACTCHNPHRHLTRCDAEAKQRVPAADAESSKSPF